jgi:hypothetical protein
MQSVTVTLTREQADLIGRLLFEFRVKSKRLADKARESAEFNDLRGRATWFAESRLDKHAANERLASQCQQLLAVSYGEDFA